MDNYLFNNVLLLSYGDYYINFIDGLKLVLLLTINKQKYPVYTKRYDKYYIVVKLNIGVLVIELTLEQLDRYIKLQQKIWDNFEVKYIG